MNVTPFGVIVMRCISGCGLIAFVWPGRYYVFVLGNTDCKCWFSILALVWLSDRIKLSVC